jgi:hypothetical protein
VTGVAADQRLRELLDLGGQRRGMPFEHGLAPARHTFVRVDLQEQPARRHEIGAQGRDLHGEGTYMYRMRSTRPGTVGVFQIAGSASAACRRTEAVTLQQSRQGPKR